jgi:hypothetical protein
MECPEQLDVRKLPGHLRLRSAVWSARRAWPLADAAPVTHMVKRVASKTEIYTGLMRRKCGM